MQALQQSAKTSQGDPSLPKLAQSGSFNRSLALRGTSGHTVPVHKHNTRTHQGLQAAYALFTRESSSKCLSYVQRLGTARFLLSALQLLAI